MSRAETVADGPSGPRVAFDVIETLFALDRPRERLAEVGAPPHALDLWFARALRDAFAWSHAGGCRPLRAFLEPALPDTLVTPELGADPDRLDDVMGSLAELDPAPGAREALDLLRAAGWEVVTLTNGSEALSRALLERADLLDRFVETISCDRIGRTKRHPDVDAMAKADGIDEVWLVASHAWDVAGATRAGLRTVWIGAERAYRVSVYPSPDLIAADLLDAARRMLEHHERHAGSPDPTG